MASTLELGVFVPCTELRVVTSKKFLLGASPWSVLLFDLGALFIALGVGYQLRFNFNVPDFELDLALPVIPLYIITGGLFMLLIGTHKGIIQHSSVDDVRRIVLAMALTTGTILILNGIRYRFFDGSYFLPRTVVMIAGMASVLGMLTLRVLAKMFYRRLFKTAVDATNVLIIGSGEAALLTKRSLDNEQNKKVVGFLGGKNRISGNRLDGLRVYSYEDRNEILLADRIDEAILAAEQISETERLDLVDHCLEQEIDLLRVPPIRDWINNELRHDQIRQVRIEDLLGRQQIVLQDQELSMKLGKGTALVTGAAGSIGSEICRQLLSLGCTRLVMVDSAESALYDLQMELFGEGYQERIVCVVGDVRNRQSMQVLFNKHAPNYVYHAAAYKHVPLMESTPCEAITTNVEGSRIVAGLAHEFGAERFVLISTDKAVNPTSVMGSSKRAAEKAVRSIARNSKTVFIITRFGNVLGSNGSVIPLFKRQLEKGGPLTVTHPEVTRYFMTIAEACRLVLEAACMGKGGEIYLFDMGRSVRIDDLARRMIKLSGLRPDKDIEIVYTGLRPGEKLYEELLASEENALPTHHPRILIGKVAQQNDELVNSLLDQLALRASERKDEEVIDLLRSLVPEYREEKLER